MSNRKKSRAGGWRAFRLAAPLCLCLFLAVLTGHAAAPPGGGGATGGVGKGTPRDIARIEPPVGQEDGEVDPYGSGRAILNVTSTPVGAVVFLGDRELGATPWSGSTLPAGRFTLRLRLPNHEPVAEIVELVSGVAVNKSYTLALGQGSLAVQTSPPHARVYLDGLEQQGKTPLEIAAVPAGAHRIKVHLDQYYDAEQSVEVEVDWVTRVKFDLKGGNLVACGERWLEPEAAALCREEAEGKKIAALVGEFVKVPGGCFEMGDAFGAERSDERPLHEVCLDAFAIGKFEVTQGQWLAVMGKNPAYFKKGNAFPVEQVSWAEAQNFISRLNALTDKNFRLPSEAEWEYAARSGGKKELYAGGEKIADLAWYGGNSGATTHAVGTRQPNGLGIYDMSGNVGEWVQDWYDSDYYEFSPRNNPVGPLGGCSGRVIRGGGWNIEARLARASTRDRYEPSNRFAAIGFRVAYSVK